MSLKCLFGHKWNGCKCERCGEIRDEQHNWDLCNGKCKRCGKTQVEQHNWNGCKCSQCGKVRDEQHDWLCKGKCKRCGKTRDEQHDWSGCKCKQCGKTRNEQHDWDGCKCKRCGKTRDEQHDWDGCKCKRCGKVRNEQHDWDLCKGKCIHFCIRCGATQPKQHNWNGCKCSICGKIRDEQHEWNGCICSRCGKVNHDWELVEGKKKCLRCGKDDNVSKEQFDNVKLLNRNQLKKRFLEFDTTWSVQRLQPYYKEALFALKSGCDDVSFWWATRTLHQLFIINDDYFRERIFELDDLNSAKDMITKLHLDNIRYGHTEKSKWQIIHENICILNEKDMINQYNNAVTISEFSELLAEKINDYSRPHTEQERRIITEEACNLASKFDCCSVVNRIVKIIGQNVAYAQQRQSGGGGVWTQSVDLRTGTRSATSTQPSDYNIQKFGEEIIASLNKQILKDCIQRKDYSIIPNDKEANYNYNLLLKNAYNAK